MYLNLFFTFLIFISGEGIGNPELCFWIKPFSKRFDVSINLLSTRKKLYQERNIFASQKPLNVF